MADRVVFTSVTFGRFKALSRFSVPLRRTNILVGPNNAGKSTILSAFRVLASGLRIARSRSPEPIRVGSETRPGYRLQASELPISVANVHTEYSDEPSEVVFRLSDDTRLKLHFPTDGGCILLVSADGRPPAGPSEFRKRIPCTVGTVPTLGPLEDDEVLVQEETVRRALTSHRASRHFRNYWRNSPGQFSEFAELISKTWPGMAVEPPTLDYGLGGAYLRMFCLEERIPRELFWVGFGFQSWCQLLTHALRCRGDTLLVVDEPEIYLHPDVQRRLLNVLRELGPDILLATHSAEIISDADPSELLLVNKRYRSAKRLSDVAGVQGALDAIGSAQNVTLAQLARNRRVFFVEGNDFTVLRRFANKLRRHDVANGTDFTVVATGGFSNWERVRGMAWGLERTIGHQLLLAGAFDRDYRSQEEIAYVSGELAKHCAFVHIHERKEIENYLLDLPVLERATQRALRDRGRRRGADETMPAVDIAKLLTDITDSMHSDTLAQYIARRQEFRSRGREDKSAVVGATVSWFEAQWRTLDTRLQIVSGKAVLRALNGSLQSLAKVNLTVAMIVDEFHIEEIPADILTLLDLLDRYRRTTVIEETDEVEDE